MSYVLQAARLQAAVHVARDQYVDAVDKYQRALALEPDSATTHVLLAHEYMHHLDDISSALRHYLAALDLDASFVAAHDGAAACYVALDDTPHARQHYVAAKDAAPRSFETRLNLAMFLVQHTDEYVYAARQFVKALDIDDTSAVAHLNLGVINMTTFQRVDVALEHFEAALRIDPDYPQAHYNLALLLSAREDYDAALVHYEQCIALVPADARAMYNAANLLRDHLDDIPRAITLYEQVLEVDPHHTGALVNLAALLLQDGHTNGALSYLRTAVTYDPTSALAQANLALVLDLHVHDYTAAVEPYLHALTLEPGDSELRLRFVRMLVTHCPSRIDECKSQLLHELQSTTATPETALVLLDVALKSKYNGPDMASVIDAATARFCSDVRFLVQLATLLTDCNVEHARALCLCDNALQLQPGNQQAHTLRGKLASI